MPLNREDDLHLTSLAAGAQVFIPPNPLASPRAIAPQALTPRDASTIFGEIARFGYSSLQQVPGGVRIASGDGVSVLNLTGTGWEFTEDLSRSLFEPAIEKMAVSIRAYLDRPAMAGAIMLPQTVDLQAVWENLGEAADEHIAARFLSDQARLVVGGIAGVNFNGVECPGIGGDSEGWYLQLLRDDSIADLCMPLGSSMPS